jgi:histidinol-phosphate aminotransferase
MNLAELARPDILALEPYASARILADSAGILLNANENPWPPAHDGGQELNRYPDPQPPVLKKRLAEYYDIADEQLLITRGSDEGIDLLVRAFCRAGRDQVLICPPCFGMYALYARIQGAGVVEVGLIEGADDWSVDFAGIDSAPACRLYFLCSPNNPTGNCIDADQVVHLASSVEDHGLVIVDEAYQEFSPSPSLIGRLPQAPNLVVLRTLSKAHGLAGCRIGAVIAGADIIELLGRVLAPYPLPTPSVQAALIALGAPSNQKRQLEEIRRNKARLLEALAQHPGIDQVWSGQANFVLVRTSDGASLVADAARAGIRLRDQSTQPGLADCVRITIGNETETTALIDFLNGWPT